MPRPGLRATAGNSELELAGATGRSIFFASVAAMQKKESTPRSRRNVSTGRSSDAGFLFVSSADPTSATTKQQGGFTMAMRPFLVSILCCSVVAGCGAPALEDEIELAEVSSASSASITLQWSFVNTAQDWTGGFSDYILGMESSIGFQSGWSPMPSPLSGGGFKLSGNNSSDDLWMFTAKTLTRTSHGIVPNATYDVTMTVWLASNAPSNCFGTGGAPGESVWLKGNVVSTQPRTFVSGDEVFFNINKGNQAVTGPSALSFGNLANGDSCDLPPRYKLLQRTATRPTPVRATSNGNLWIYFGSDSGFESRSTYFIDQVRVTLTRRS
jgi:hypothetical protein